MGAIFPHGRIQLHLCYVCTFLSHPHFARLTPLFVTRQSYFGYWLLGSVPTAMPLTSPSTNKRRYFRNNLRILHKIHNLQIILPIFLKTKQSLVNINVILSMTFFVEYIPQIPDITSITSNTLFWLEKAPAGVDMFLSKI